MKLIVLRCSGLDFETSCTLALPADWTAIPLNRALQIAFGREGDVSFVFRDAAYRECVFDANEDRLESGLSFATPLSGLLPKDGWRLLWLEGENKRRVLLRRIGEEDGESPVCREASDAAPDFPAIQPSWTPEYAYIPPKPSFIDSFSDSATRVMDQINRMDIASVWSNVSASVESLARLSDGVKSTLEASRSDAERIIGNLSGTAAAVRDLVERLRENPSLLIREHEEQRLPETR